MDGSSRSIQAIGSGGQHASILLSMSGQHRDQSMAQTVYTVYLAKVNAEMAPGVGDATDLAIITKAGTEFLTDAFIERLEALREKLNGQQPTAAQVDELFAKRKEA